MKIFRAIGFGLLLIFLQLLIPRLFHGFEDAFLSLFKLLQTTFDVSQQAVAHTSLTGLSLPQIHP